MTVKLLNEHHLEILISSESTLVEMPHCWKSHVAAQMGYSGYTIIEIEGNFYALFLFTIKLKKQVSMVRKCHLKTTRQ